MERKVWSNVFRWVLIISTSFIIICLAIIAYKWITDDHKRLLLGSRDLLSVLADVGKASGTLALLGLMYQVLWREQDRINRLKPKIKILDASMDTIDRASLVGLSQELCGFEKNPNSLVTGEYKEFVLNVDTKKGQRVLVIEIENQQSDPSGDAKEVQLELELKFETAIGKKIEQPFSIKCPHNSNLTLNSNSTKKIYINCSLDHKTMGNMEIISGMIKNYTCRNNENRLIDGRKNNLFSTYPIGEQPLWDKTGTVSPPSRTSTEPPNISEEDLEGLEDLEDLDGLQIPEDIEE
ncbi:MAG: hypothetical protein AAGG68_28860 [Bacteroidota bacterium]